MQKPQPKTLNASDRAFKKRFGLMAVTTGHGLPFENRAQKMKELKEAWDSGFNWAQKALLFT